MLLWINFAIHFLIMFPVCFYLYTEAIQEKTNCAELFILVLHWLSIEHVTENLINPEM
jgi:hypothetical protein